MFIYQKIVEQHLSLWRGDLLSRVWWQADSVNGQLIEREISIRVNFLLK